MATLADILKAKDPNAEDKLRDVANSSELSSVTDDPSQGLTSDNIDAINNDPKLVDQLQEGLKGKSQIAEPEMAAAGAKKDAVESVFEKLKDLPDEHLDGYGTLGDLIKRSRAGKIAGVIAESPITKMVGKTMAGAAIPLEAGAAIDNLKKGNVVDAAGNAVGAGAGIAALAGSPAVGPMGAVAGAKAAGDIVSGAMGGEHGAMAPATQGGATTPPVLPPQQPNSFVQAGFSPDSPDGPTDAELADSRNTPASDEDDSEDEDNSPKPASMGSGKTHIKGYHREGSEGGTAEQNARLMALMQGDGGTINTVANMKQAQDQSNALKLAGMYSQGINQIAQGAIGQKYKATPDDNTKDFYKQYQQNANIPVEHLKELGEQEKNDPVSGPSQQASAFAQQMLQKAGLPAKLAAGMSYNQIEKNFPQIAKMMEVNESNKNRQAIMQLKYAELAQNKSDKSDTKNKDAQNKSLTQTQQLLESARGNPAAAQAEKDIYAADKAKSLANLYGDPNKLSPQMAQLLSSEIAKIAAGGSPTQHELDGLTPNTLRSSFSNISQKLMNSPTPANAGEFIKQFQDYGNALTKDAQKVIQDKYGRVIETRKKQLGDDNYKALQDQYLNRFKSNVDSGVKQDPKISQYASSHGLDYDSAKSLLTNRGYKPQE